MSNENAMAEYVREQLHSIAKSTGFTDYRFEQDVGSNHGDGFVGTMMNIIISGQRSVDGGIVKPNKLHLICKMLPPNQAQRDMIGSEIAFDRETEMYNRILPLFAQFQAERGLTTANGFFEYPHCYYAISDSKQNRHLIIMDDLRSTGYTLWDKLVPIEYDNVRLLLTALGRFHGVSLAFGDQRPEVFTSFRTLDDVLLDMLKKSTGMSTIISDSLAVCIGLFEGRPELEYLTKLNKTWQKDLDALLGGERLQQFSVIGHGDCWNNNFMFLNRNNKPDKICLLDWQVSRLGSPALDLSYFFMLSTNKELRDKHYDEFLQIYYAELAATVRACGSDIDTLFTFSDLQDQLRLNGRYGIILTPMFLQAMISKPENIKHMDKLAEQNVGEFKTMVVLDDETKNVYVKRASDAINDAKAYGWIK